jgi:hypothetical protein
MEFNGLLRVLVFTHSDRAPVTRQMGTVLNVIDKKNPSSHMGNTTVVLLAELFLKPSGKYMSRLL